MIRQLAALCLISIISASIPVPGKNETCMQSQSCIRTTLQKYDKCPNPDQIMNPELHFWQPKQFDQNDQSLSQDFQSVCPFMGTWEFGTLTSPVCCTADQVSVLVHSFKQIDSVFGENVPLCGLNLKKLWCEYTCNPRQTDFVTGLGYTQKQHNGFMTNFTDIQFTVNEDMACTLFQSCKQVSLIAQASIQSSISFLDFLGVNGQNQSLSIITFNLEGSNVKSPEDLHRKCKSRGLEFDYDLVELEDAVPDNEQQDSLKIQTLIELPANNKTIVPLDIPMYPCNQSVPTNKSLDGYGKITNSTCTYCSAVCQAPTINSEIGFFDGFNTAFLWVSIGSIGLTIAWQIYFQKIRKPQTELDWKFLKEELQEAGGNIDNINQTDSSKGIKVYN